MTDQDQVLVGVGEGRHRRRRVLGGSGPRVLGRQIHREDPMTEAFQLRGEPFPAPGAVICAVDQAEVRHQ